MSQAAALAQRLQEVILDGMWIANTNFKKELDNTSLDEVSIQIKTYNKTQTQPTKTTINKSSLVYIIFKATTHI